MGILYKLCSDMNIINNLPEYVRPKNVGLMFFSMEPEKFFPYTQIDVVQFPEGLGGNDIIENIFKGPIHQQLRDALQFIRNTIITEKVVKYPDRAEADRSVTQEGLKTYRVSNRRYRNRRIGDFLKELHLTEGRNTGFKKILNAFEDNGSPKPEFETDDDHSYFISRLFVHKEFLKYEELESKQKGAKKEPKKENNRKQKILELLVKNPTMTQSQLIEKLTLTRKQIQKDIKELQEANVLSREGSNRSGRWIVRK